MPNWAFAIRKSVSVFSVKLVLYLGSDFTSGVRLFIGFVFLWYLGSDFFRGLTFSRVRVVVQPDE